MNSHGVFGSSGQTSKRDRKRLLERLNRPQVADPRSFSQRLLLVLFARSFDHIPKYYSKPRQLVNLELNEYERVICEGIVDPKTLSVTFDQIGGLEEQKKEVHAIPNTHTNTRTHTHIYTHVSQRPLNMLLFLW